MPDKKNNGISERPPVIVVTGHIDHGKSSLLDYIRKTNIVEKEAGGITQHISAYEVVHKNEAGVPKKITFLDTPGHEAFSGMRERGVSSADIAILVVSAEDSVKAQTIEALKTIEKEKVPLIIAINKIDKPSANPEKVKADLAEKEVYLEGFGGNVPCVLISAKTGEGIPALLDMILLVAEMEELKGNYGVPAEGVVIESHIDPKRGISATLLIKNGTLRSGDVVVAEDAIAPARIIEDFLGRSIKETAFSSPVAITGFSKLPRSGAPFKTHGTKKEAEEAVMKFIEETEKMKQAPGEEIAALEGTVLVPLIIKTDVLGTLEAIEKEVSKIKKEGVILKIIGGAGAISESDVKMAGSMNGSILAGFNVKTEKAAADLADRMEIKINHFDVIYKIAEWLEKELEERRPKVAVDEVTGKAKILRCFSRVKDKQVIGGRVLEGNIVLGAKVKIMRRDFEIGRGEIVELQQNKAKAREVIAGNEFGVNIESKTEIAPGDTVEAYITVTK